LWYKKYLDSIYMRLQKRICTLLIPLLAISFLAGAASAATVCDEFTCRRMVMPAGHHGAKPMIPEADCCSRHQQAPCELERRQPMEISAFWTFPGRLQNHPFIISSDTACGLQPPNRPGGVLHLSSPVEAKARTVPIYLVNLALIC